VVNHLKEYKVFQGILIPTYIVYDKIGWESSPTHYLISEVLIDPKIDDAVFESAEIDFGKLSIDGETMHAQIMGTWSGSLMTNIRMEDLVEAQIPMKSRIKIQVGETMMEIRVLENIQTSAAEIKPGEVYLCQYPISGFPRFFLMGWDLDVAALIPCEKGDDLVLTKTADQEAMQREGES